MMWAVWFSRRGSPGPGRCLRDKGDICLEVFVLTIGVSLVTPLASLSGF